MMTEKERLKIEDMKFYASRIALHLPENILDFHAHIWTEDHWKLLPWKNGPPGGTYMVVRRKYTIEDLFSDAKILFPGRGYSAVCFGIPTPAGDTEKSNAYSAKAGVLPGVYPLLLAGKGLASRKKLERSVLEEGFYGYKIFLPWHGDDYGDMTVEAMIGQAEMEVADRYGLIVLLHVPRSGRLADPVIQKEVRSFSERYPNARIVLAHCGRCYHPDQMFAAINSIKYLENVFLDTAMVMEPEVLHILFSEISSKRILFATDLPVAMMRGRRVYVMDHWVDLVQNGYPPSDYRVSGHNFRATFMVYEIILSILRAAKMTGLSRENITGIFHDNGTAILAHVNHERSL